jgi:hypothetical protein
VDVPLDAVERVDASVDVDSVSARVAAAVDDARLNTPGGRQLHIENVTDLLRAR